MFIIRIRGVNSGISGINFIKYVIVRILGMNSGISGINFIRYVIVMIRGMNSGINFIRYVSQDSGDELWNLWNKFH